ncbi:putative Protein NLRC3 [Paratrimastix pyriformis]|uniref:Uncharacterized protein n=1 Tax=Paratrimastix pyriformis TaxID=342808 RepID=A0ABQ8UJD7_9EUKA|nr:putative Protein NLRC3 [Paratrimastix pyriformis]
MDPPQFGTIPWARPSLSHTMRCQIFNGVDDALGVTKIRRTMAALSAHAPPSRDELFRVFSSDKRKFLLTVRNVKGVFPLSDDGKPRKVQINISFDNTPSDGYVFEMEGGTYAAEHFQWDYETMRPDDVNHKFLKVECSTIGLFRARTHIGTGSVPIDHIMAGPPVRIIDIYTPDGTPAGKVEMEFHCRQLETIKITPHQWTLGFDQPNPAARYTLKYAVAWPPPTATGVENHLPEGSRMTTQVSGGPLVHWDVAPLIQTTCSLDLLLASDLAIELLQDGVLRASGAGDPTIFGPTLSGQLTFENLPVVAQMVPCDPRLPSRYESPDRYINCRPATPFKHISHPGGRSSPGDLITPECRDIFFLATLPFLLFCVQRPHDYVPICPVPVPYPVPVPPNPLALFEAMRRFLQQFGADICRNPAGDVILIPGRSVLPDGWFDWQQLCRYLTESFVSYECTHCLKPCVIPPATSAPAGPTSASSASAASPCAAAAAPAAPASAPAAPADSSASAPVAPAASSASAPAAPAAPASAPASAPAAPAAPASAPVVPVTPAGPATGDGAATSVTTAVDAGVVAGLQEEVHRRTEAELAATLELRLSDGERAALSAARSHEGEWLELTEMGIGDDCATCLATWLQTNRTITVLNLGKNTIGDEGAQALAAVLAPNNALRVLCLSDNRIADDGARALAEMLERNRAIEQHSPRCKPARCDLRTINAIAILPSRRVSDFSFHGLGGGILQLNIQHNRIGVNGARAILAALEHNHTLQELSLRETFIRDDGAQALGAILEHNNTVLRKLDLSDNVIRDDGARALGSMLKHNTILKMLDLSGNWIGDDGARALGVALKSNTTLEKLVLTDQDSYDSWKATNKTHMEVRVNLDQTVAQLKTMINEKNGGSSFALAVNGNPLPASRKCSTLALSNSSALSTIESPPAQLFKEGMVPAPPPSRFGTYRTLSSAQFRELCGYWTTETRSIALLPNWTCKMEENGIWSQGSWCAFAESDWPRVVLEVLPVLPAGADPSQKPLPLMSQRTLVIPFRLETGTLENGWVKSTF